MAFGTALRLTPLASGNDGGPSGTEGVVGLRDLEVLFTGGLGVGLNQGTMGGSAGFTIQW